MFSLLFLSIGLTVAVTPENIRIIQEQSAMVAEASLSQVMSRCMLNHFCAVGVAEADGRIPTKSLAGALVDSYYIIDTVLETTAEQGAKLDNFDKIKSAFELGHTGRKEGLCDQVFACENKNIDIALPSVARSQQVDCSDLAQVCPGLSISCSLCGLFLPGTCAATCPMAGLFCGGSGYLCKLAAGTPTTTPPARIIDIQEPQSASQPRNLNPKFENVLRMA